MPSPAVMQNGTQVASGNANLDGTVQAYVAPFTRASAEHREPMLDVTPGLITANASVVGPVDVPAFGFLRGIWLLVEATGGAGAAAVAKEDSPYSYISNLQVSDVNGAPIVGPIDGFDLSLINIVGGYRKVDPNNSPAFGAVVATGNFSFILYIPIEISARDGLGSLPNQNAAQTFKMSLTCGPLSSVYSVNPTTAPSVRVRAWADTWAQPEPTDLNGMPNAQQPPALGTTQFWTKSIAPIVAGQNTVRLPRVGNLIRSLIFVFRNATPVRSSASFPDPFQLTWDGRILENSSRLLQQHDTYSRSPVSTFANGADASTTGSRTGVFVVPFNHDLDQKFGDEMRDLWLPTNSGTRLQLEGNFAAAGSLAIITNDVAPYGNVYTD